LCLEPYFAPKSRFSLFCNLGALSKVAQKRGLHSALARQKLTTDMGQLLSMNKILADLGYGGINFSIFVVA
jgi:hypothetical protein